ncbi:MAG: hypothetical protein KDD70_15875, partial [Bdellovibrionales bacterium]|nr:hypothetical protein [Bdellovibrionales bacterium]
MKKVTARYLIIQEGLALVFLLAFCSVSPSWAIAPGEDLGSIYHPTNLDYIGEARVSDGTTVVLGVPDQSAVGGLIMHPQSLTGLIDVTNSSAIIRHDSASVNLGSGAGSSLVILPGGKLFVGAPLTTSSTFSGTNPHGRIRIASMNAVNYFNDNTGYEYDLSSNPLSPLPNGNNAGTYAGVGSYLTNWNIDLSQSLGAGFGDAAVAFGQPNGKQYLAVSAPRARPVLTYQYLCEGVSYPNYQRYCDDKDTGVVIIFEYIPASQRFVPIQTFWNPGDEFLSG